MRRPPDRTKGNAPAAVTAEASGPQNPQSNERTRNMNSIATPPFKASELALAVHLIPVQFYSDTLILVEHDGHPYVVMKPLVVAIGLDWPSQSVKLAKQFGSVVVEITTTGSDGKMYSMTCLPLRKLPAWLYSLNPGKVSASVRPKVILYKEKSDEALWCFWTQQAPAQHARAGGADNQDKLLARSSSLRKELATCTSYGAAVDAYADYVMIRVRLGQTAAPMIDLAPGVRQFVLTLEGGAA